jgi:hypothetical protein
MNDERKVTARPTAPVLVNGRYEWTDRHGRKWQMAYDNACNSYNRDDRDALLGINAALREQLDAAEAVRSDEAFSGALSDELAKSREAALVAALEKAHTLIEQLNSHNTFECECCRKAADDFRGNGHEEKGVTFAALKGASNAP